MLIELGELQEARLWADKALEQFPNEAELLAGKAVALARSGDLQAALAFSDAAIEEKGSTPYVWLARGDVLLAREEKRAEYCFEQALAAAPGDWTWGWLASRIHYYYKKFSLALRYASQALGVDAAHAVLWLQLGTCQAALGLTAAAYGSFEQARELDPKNADVSAAIAQLRDLTLTDRLVGQFRRWLA
jgi:tetratricopeptide (TPR) repeat protein